MLLINSKVTKLQGIHRTFGFFPSTISAVCIGFIWQMIYDSKRGLLNYFLEKIGREDLQKVWLNEPKLVMLLVSIPLIWQFIGYYMVILLSAVPRSVRRFWNLRRLTARQEFSARVT